MPVPPRPTMPPEGLLRQIARLRDLVEHLELNLKADRLTYCRMGVDSIEDVAHDLAALLDEHVQRRQPVEGGHL